MANRRMLSRTLSGSFKFHALFQVGFEGFETIKKPPNGFPEFTQSLYMLMLPYTDDFGRMSGDSFGIKQNIMPGAPREVDHFDLALQIMHNVRLITLYGEHKEFLQVENFDEFQSGLINKRTTSKFPENNEPFKEFPVNSKNFLELSRITNLTKLNLTKLNLTKLSKDIEPHPPKEKKDRFLDCVYLSKEHHTKLVKDFGEAKTNALIERLNNYVMSKGKQYKSHYHTILAWERADNGKKPGAGISTAVRSDAEQHYPVDL